MTRYIIDRRLAIAPMLDYTDRFFRYLLRLISRRTLLYTEMITTGALLHGDTERFLAYHPMEHPLAIQLGGSDPTDLARCARVAGEQGYDEINLNLGCPSDRVKSGRFGACLMAEPERVADCIRAMRDATGVPITVKTRIGIDHQDSYAFLTRLVETLAAAGCGCFIIHARKAWLQGLSPKQNRDIPPLRYDRVIRLKRDFPDLQIVLNGGITSLDEVTGLLNRVDGVMIGREAYHNPWLLAAADTTCFGVIASPVTRHQILEAYLPFIEQQLESGIPLQQITRHLLGLFHGVPGARSWRRYLSEHAHKRGAGIEVVRQAASLASLDPSDQRV